MLQSKVCVLVCVLIIISSVLSQRVPAVSVYDDRDKRTVGTVLRNVADLFGYDVQKRPTVIPPAAPAGGAAPAPAPAAPAG